MFFRTKNAFHFACLKRAPRKILGGIFLYITTNSHKDPSQGAPKNCVFYAIFANIDHQAQLIPITKNDWGSPYHPISYFSNREGLNTAFLPTTVPSPFFYRHLGTNHRILFNFFLWFAEFKRADEHHKGRPSTAVASENDILSKFRHHWASWVKYIRFYGIIWQWRSCVHVVDPI